MIYIRNCIENPFASSSLKNLFWKEVSLSKNKFFSIELIKDSAYLINLCFIWSRKIDHAGIEIGLGLFGFEVNLSIKDKRHWDYEKNTWTTY